MEPQQTKSFKELLKEAKLKHQQRESTSTRNFLNESYQQHDYLNVKPSIERLIKSLEALSQKEPQAEIKCFDLIVSSVSKHCACILSMGKAIAELFQNEPLLTLKHQHYNSQSILLALYLKLYYGAECPQIVIATGTQNKKHWEKYLVSDKDHDPQSTLDAILSKHNIAVEYLQKINSKSLPENVLLLIDIFNVEYTTYHHYLFGIRNQFSSSSKVLLYHSHIQSAEVEQLLQVYPQEFTETEVCIEFPIEASHVQKDSEIKQNLIKFLKEDINHPEKQDIIVFYKNEHLANSTAKRYASKLKELISQEKLQPYIHIISQSNEFASGTKNNIFIAENAAQLQAWNYNYDNVFYVIDYGWDTYFRKDQSNIVYEEGLRKEDPKEKARRMAFVGVNKVGRYVYREQALSDSIAAVEEASDITPYCLKMVNLQLGEFLDRSNSRISSCLDYLVELGYVKISSDQKLQLSDAEATMCLLANNVDPIHAHLIRRVVNAKEKTLDKTSSKSLTNLLIIALAVISTRGNLRLSKDSMDSKSIVKPSGVWRRSGYLHSCLEIVTKAEIIENRKNKNSRSQHFSKRKTSRANEDEFEVYGSLFEIITPKKLEFEDMEMDDLIREYCVNDLILTEIREKVDELRDFFEVEQKNVNVDIEMVSEVSEHIASIFHETVARFSGSRRSGYLTEKSAVGKSAESSSKPVFPHKDSLISQLNETPQFVIVARNFALEDSRQILMCNHLSVDNYMSVFGSLPQKRQDSVGEFELQFHGISSSIFKALYKNNSFEMKRFEKEYSCFIEPNQDMATITVYCKKEASEGVKSNFEELLTKVKEKYVNYNKVIHYLGNTNISMSNGGQIKEVIKDNYINSCSLNNLHLEVEAEDLEELFDEFFVLKDIQVLDPEPNKFYKSAIIHFNSQKDYYRFHSYYHECTYLDRRMEVKPIPAKKVETATDETYIEFKWYIWKSHQKALVEFSKKEAAQEAFKKFVDNPILDNKKFTIQLQENKILLNEIGKQCDEIFLEKTFSVYGELKTVEILKTPLKQPSNQEYQLQNLIKEKLDNDVNLFKINDIEKCKNGLRKCKVDIKGIEHLVKLVEMNGKKLMGQGRLYAESWFVKPILVAYPQCLQLYNQLLQEVIDETNKKQGNAKVNIQSYLKNLSNNRVYLCIKSPMKETIDYISKAFEEKLQPSGVDLTENQKNIILSDIGLQNLIDLEEKFNCKLVVNSLKKTLQVMCKFQNLKRIKEEINARVEDSFFYRISLNNKSFKNLSENKQKLEEIKKTYFLSLLQLEEFSKTLIFEGSALQVQNALNYMMHLIESFSVPEEELVNTDVCLICYEQPFRPYRLQNCGHKFCFACLDQCINSALGDASMFPIKCPHCMLELSIDDLESSIEKGNWAKLINIAANKFVGLNAETLTFCYTAGCKQINALNLKNFKCDTCEQSYCVECKMNWHPGLTCQQAKSGGDALFKKYMKENGIRECPYKNCKMPIVRTDGCYRVTCTRCNHSMCFKCDPDKMFPFPNYNDCYKHLNDVHGSYW